jgi:hypothetical protein
VNLKTWPDYFIALLFINHLRHICFPRFSVHEFHELHEWTTLFVLIRAIRVIRGPPFVLIRVIRGPIRVIRELFLNQPPSQKTVHEFTRIKTRIKN